MRKARVVKSLVTALFFAVLCVPAVGQERDPWQELRAVCEIKVSNGGPRKGWSGSGTLVAKKDGIGLILSCRHVNTKLGMPVEVVWHGSNKQRARGYVVYVNPGGPKDWGTDLAVVLAPVPDSLVPVLVAKFDPSHGPWRSAGYRGGKFYVSTATTAREQNSAIVLNSPFVGGMSGGATFDNQGRLVGVVVASDRNTIGWSADGDNLRIMLSKFGK